MADEKYVPFTDEDQVPPPPDYADLFSRELDSAPVPPVPFQVSNLPTVKAYRVPHPSPAPAPAVVHHDMIQLQNENSTLKSELGECLRHADTYFREIEKGNDKKTKEGKARVRTKHWVVLKYVDSYMGQNAASGPPGRGGPEAAKTIVTSLNYGGFVMCRTAGDSTYFRSASQDKLIDGAAYHVGSCSPDLYLAPGASIEKLRAFYEANQTIHQNPPPEAEAYGRFRLPFTIEGNNSDLEWISPSLVKRGEDAADGADGAAADDGDGGDGGAAASPQLSKREKRRAKEAAKKAAAEEAAKGGGGFKNKRTKRKSRRKIRRKRKSSRNIRKRKSRGKIKRKSRGKRKSKKR